MAVRHGRKSKERPPLDGEGLEQAALFYAGRYATTRAKLRFYLTNGSSNGPQIFAVPSTWAETTVNWNNQPATTGVALADLASITTTNTWIEYSLPSGAIAGNGTYSFVMVPQSSDGITVQSRTGVNKPTLVITAL